MTADATVKTHSKKHSIPPFETHSVLLVAAIVLAMGLGAAHAQTQPREPAPAALTTTAAAEPIPPNKVTSRDVEAAFRRADRDQDGRLSRSEAEHFPMLSQRFDQVDANHDAFLSLGEFNAAAGN